MMEKVITFPLIHNSDNKYNPLGHAYGNTIASFKWIHVNFFHIYEDDSVWFLNSEITAFSHNYMRMSHFGFGKWNCHYYRSASYNNNNNNNNYIGYLHCAHIHHAWCSRRSDITPALLGSRLRRSQHSKNYFLPVPILHLGGEWQM